MATFTTGSLTEIRPPRYLDAALPAVFDDMSFAFSLGLRNRTVWWLIHATSIDNLEAGKGTYDTFQVPKKSGGTRTIHAPKPTLKRVQRVLLQVYFDKFPVGAHVGAYVKGRDMVYSVNKHVKKDVVISMDLSDFFGSTKRRWVREWLRSAGYNADVAAVISGLVTVPVRRNGHISHVVPQGAPTSGSVTNQVATYRLDHPLRILLRQAGLKDVAYTRYADDLTISYNGFLPKEDFDKLMSDIKAVIAKSGYRVNRAKTRVAVSRPSGPVPQRMLGMSIHEKANVPRQKKRLLRARVHQECVLAASPEPTDAAVVADRVDRLKAELRYWARISPDTISPLILKLEGHYP